MSGWFWRAALEAARIEQKGPWQDLNQPFFLSEGRCIFGIQFFFFFLDFGMCGGGSLPKTRNHSARPNGQTT